MKKTLLTLCALALAGCANMTPAEKRNTALIVGGIIVVGAIAANSGSGGSEENCYFVVTPGEGGYQVCR